VLLVQNLQVLINTAIGQAAGNDLQGTANRNTIVGTQAASSMTTGYENTCIGTFAGDAITTGNNNIIIGVSVDPNSATDVHVIAIGVGITGAPNDFTFGKAGNVVFNDFDTDAAWTRSSDERLKKNITDQTLGLDFINDLRTVKYKWKANDELDASDSQLAHLRETDDDGNIINYMNTDATMHNFIAQEVKAALDTAGVSSFGGWKEDHYGVQQVSREMFVIPLVKAVQELSTKLDAALARIATLEG
jgi:trimeric autotransporter adhesin